MVSPHTPISALKYVGALIFVLIAASISGCQIKSAPAAKPAASKFTPEEVEAYRLQRFAEGMQWVLRKSILDANRQQLTGEVKLSVVINLKNELIGCEVVGAPQSTDAKAASDLGALVKSACWNSVFPPVPPLYFNDKGIAEVRIPLILTVLADYQLERLEDDQLRFAQSQFFWERTMANQPPENIGIASFNYRANAQGEVQKCRVSLAPTRWRSNSFKKRDRHLLRQLTEQCEELNLSAMPGFQVDEKGLARGNVSVEYMPWRGGPKQH